MNATIRMTRAGCPYVCEDSDPVRLAVLEDGHPDDDLPFGPDLTDEEEELLPE